MYWVLFINVHVGSMKPSFSYTAFIFFIIKFIYFPSNYGWYLSELPLNRTLFALGKHVFQSLLKSGLSLNLNHTKPCAAYWVKQLNIWINVDQYQIDNNNPFKNNAFINIISGNHFCSKHVPKCHMHGTVTFKEEELIHALNCCM